MVFWFIIFLCPWVAIPATVALAIPTPPVIRIPRSDHHIGPILQRAETRDWTIIPRDSDLTSAALSGIFSMAPGPHADVLKAVGDEVVEGITSTETRAETEMEPKTELESDKVSIIETPSGDFVDMDGWKLLKRWRSWLWESKREFHDGAYVDRIKGPDDGARVDGVQKRIPPKEGSPYLHCTGQRTAPLCCAKERGEDVGCESPVTRPNDVMDFIRLCGNVNQAARCCTVTIHGFTCEEPNGRLHYTPGHCDKIGLLGFCND